MRSVSLRLVDLERKPLIPLGFEGENEYMTINFDCKTVFDKHPAAVPTLAVTPPQGDSYPAIVVRDGDIVSWTVCDSDLVYPGEGELQLTFVDGTIIGKTYKARTKVLDSITPSGEAPTPIQNWLIQAAAALQALPQEVSNAVVALMGAMVGVGETLDPDDDVTVNYDPVSNTLTIGVPHGRDGEDGHTPAITANKVGKVATFYVDGVAIVQISDGQDADPTALIDDTSTAQNRTWSAKKLDEENRSLKTEINSIEEELVVGSKTVITEFADTQFNLDVPDDAVNISVNKIYGSHSYSDGVLKVAAVSSVDVYDESGNFVRSIEVPSNITSKSGYGMGFDNDHYNYFDLETGKYYGVCGYLDLGSVDWTYSSTYGRFATSDAVDNISVPDSNNTMNTGDYILYGKEYLLTTMNNTASGSYNNRYSIGTNGKIVIRDESYTDAATFKAAMSGVYIVFLYETPVEESIAGSMSGEVVGGGFVRFNNTGSLSVYAEGIFTEMLTDSIKDVVEAHGNEIHGYYDISKGVVPQLVYSTGVSVGDTVSLTPTVSTSGASIVVDCTEGDLFRVNTQSGSGVRGWCFIDNSNKCQSVCAASKVVTNAIITAPKDGKLIVQTNSRSVHPIKLEKYGALPEKNRDILDAINRFNTRLYPLVNLEYDYNMRDVSAELEEISFSSRSAVLPQIYDLYDGLVSDYPEFVTKYDLAEEMDIDYPTYANGTTDDPTYGTTPAYKTYMYRFKTDYQYIGNDTSCKHRKMILVTGTHGWEVAAPFAGYLFMKQLCDGFLNDPNFYKFRNAWDVWVVPCLDGWGMYHESRTNANGVNINRNYPVSFWKEEGSGTTNYTGASAGSEFETQLIVALSNSIKPDFAIDLHNYSATNRQFYTGLCRTEWLRLAYQSLTDCSYTFKKNLPAYFGTAFGTLINYNSLDAPERLTTPEPTTNGWWNEQDYIKMSSTLEICENIRYLNGEYTDTSTGNDQFGADTFSVAEYTIRNLIFRYANWVMQNVIE